MGLSNDQRAMLRLLAQREEGYEDIAALMGIGVDEVRVRVKEALAELQAAEAGESAPARQAPEAPPQGKRPVPAPPPEPERPAPEAVPDPDLPPPAGSPRPPTETAPPSPPTSAGTSPPPSPPSEPPRRATPSPPRLPLPKDRRRRIELVGGALIAALLVLFAAGIVDLGGDEDSEPNGGGTAASGRNDGGTEREASNRAFTQAVLEPTGGGDASGLARFGKVENTPVLQVEAEGLEPSGKKRSYTVWLYKSPKLVLRVGAVKVPRSGGIATQLPIPEELLGLVANRTFDQIDISLTSDAAYRTELSRARKQKRLPFYTGTSVLRGRISGPLVQQGG